MLEQQTYVSGPEADRVLCFPTENDPSATLTQGEWLVMMLSQRCSPTSMRDQCRIVDAALDGVVVTGDDATLAALRQMTAECARNVLQDVFGRMPGEAISMEDRIRYIRILLSDILQSFADFHLAQNLLDHGISLGRTFLSDVLTRSADGEHVSEEEKRLFRRVSSDEHVMIGFCPDDRSAIARQVQLFGT